MTVEGHVGRSTFVTVVAWIFIILAGFGTLMSIMQNIMFSQMFSMQEMQEAMAHHDQMAEMPFWASFMFRHFQLYLFMTLLFVLSLLVSSVGLLKRKDWARKIFIVLISIAILVLIAGAGLQIAMDPASQGMPAEQIPPEFTRMMTMMKVFMVVFTAGFTILFGWIIKKLTSAGIKQEFLHA